MWMVSWQCKGSVGRMGDVCCSLAGLLWSCCVITWNTKSSPGRFTAVCTSSTIQNTQNTHKMCCKWRWNDHLLLKQLTVSSIRACVLSTPVHCAHTPVRSCQSHHRGAGCARWRIRRAHHRCVADISPGQHSKDLRIPCSAPQTAHKLLAFTHIHNSIPVSMSTYEQDFTPITLE